MLGLLTRGIKSVLSVARKIAGQVKSNSRDAVRDAANKPQERIYQVTAQRDSRTCQVCLDKDGIEFRVTSNDSVEEIAQRMQSVVPPFHTNCRCQLVPK